MNTIHSPVTARPVRPARPARFRAMNHSLATARPAHSIFVYDRPVIGVAAALF